MAICFCIMAFGLVVLFRGSGRSNEVIWSRFFPAICVGGVFIWLLGTAKQKIKAQKTRNITHTKTLKSPIGVKACSFCGAEYAKEMTVCPLDQTALVLK
jgi:hypothetical protein